MRVTPMDGRHETREEPARGSWLRGLVPIAVAAGLVAVIGGGFDVLERRYGAEQARSAKAASDAEQTAPRFAVGVVADGSALVVRDTGTGADTALPVAPPPGRRFTSVESAPDGTYIVASSGGGTATFQRLRLDDDGRPEELAPIPKATIPVADARPSARLRPALAVTPEGDRLAYVSFDGGRARVDVLALDTGARKRWTTTLTGVVGSPSWSGDTLAFVWTGSAARESQVRTIDTAAPVADLKHSKALLKLPSGVSTAILRPDGTTIVTGAVRQTRLTIQTYASTGKPQQTLWEHQTQGQSQLTALDPAENGALIALAGASTPATATRSPGRTSPTSPGDA
ncbi:hypothetical protein BJF79_01455 [Actinomadura sp. CNU-125]|uniref:hypothetical protein n=1 Tax=Actinomadura sp. CNU-125 TaxID=1904961 RepID=UPI00095FB690|nr:hypothetical protein [Actinomadura sp. CNU-125]OLT27302.1 hypothetical protein BJF79_01455 [Actinomadura sp. CNU-125]